MADSQTLEHTTAARQGVFAFGTAALLATGATVMAAPPPNESLTTSVRGQRAASTYVEELARVAVNMDDDLLAEGYRQFASDDFALAEAGLGIAAETWPAA